ncbi:HAD-IIA family hydrolase [Acidipropionibacterium timonense]|uniref:HAD-IIA family hydrolase n=1 Tax=Acidipropionibacterium timonense TaxID=2161818 RepID=UPI001030D30A|nr:HAD-IIA family hydrolase [Acidipropionibacterium timonense]
MSELVDGHDAVLFDLDGVIYLGPEPIPAAPATVAGLRERGIGVAFVTNNAARATSVVAQQLQGMGIDATAHDVVSSAEAVTALVVTHLGAGAKVLLVGTSNLDDLARERGLVPVESAQDGPDAVIQGYDPHVAWSRLEEACFAIQAGARWYAANPDLTRPTDRGLVPGLGAQIGVVATAVEGSPMMAGKPYPPLLEATVERLGCRRPLFVGDRLDTDILGARSQGMGSLFVLTGAHGVHDLLDAPQDRRPDHVGADLGALLAPDHPVTLTDSTARCGRAEVDVVDGALCAAGIPADTEGQLDLLRAILALVWAGRAAPDHDLVGRLDQLH